MLLRNGAARCETTALRRFGGGEDILLAVEEDLPRTGRLRRRPWGALSKGLRYGRAEYDPGSASQCKLPGGRAAVRRFRDQLHGLF